MVTWLGTTSILEVIFYPRHGSSVQRQLLLVQTGIRKVPWNDPLAWALLEVGQGAA